MSHDRDRRPSTPGEPDEVPVEAPRAPTEAEWAALSERGRERAMDALIASVSEEELAERDAMSEGDLHLDTKTGARDTLRRYLRRIHRSLYVGADIKVYYPGEKGFTPDLIAVRDVEVKRRRAWFASREGKGVELALEVHDQGSWRKDFVDNVAKYARLGILEYFIFDLNRQLLTGYRLAGLKAGSYEALKPIDGRYSSDVLGLDLAVEEGRLRFYHGTAALLEVEEMLERERARAEQERAQAEQERAQAEQERAQAEQERARAGDAVARLREAVLLVLRSRDLRLTAAQRARIDETDDVGLLDRWLRRALVMSPADDLFADG